MSGIGAVRQTGRLKTYAVRDTERPVYVLCAVSLTEARMMSGCLAVRRLGRALSHRKHGERLAPEEVGGIEGRV